MNVIKNTSQYMDVGDYVYLNGRHFIIEYITASTVTLRECFYDGTYGTPINMARERLIGMVLIEGARG